MDGGKGECLVIEASHERKWQEMMPAQLTHRSRSASDVEQRMPTEMVRHSVKLKVVVN